MGVNKNLLISPHKRCRHAWTHTLESFGNKLSWLARGRSSACWRKASWSSTFFMREQMALYAWRRSFFLSQFADGGWTTDCNFLCMADGVCGEVVHSQAAIHFNITENWENLLSMV